MPTAQPLSPDGCYGIGIGRLAASVCEAHHDEYGPIWPITIAPWQVHLCCMRSDNAEVHAMADACTMSCSVQAWRFSMTTGT